MKRKILFFNLLLFISLSAFSTDYYVSTTGNDANNGSLDSPWLTISKAVRSVAANAGDTIHLSEGTFTEINIIRIPSDVSLIGAGSLKTKIVVNYYYTITNFDQWDQSTYHPEKYIIQMNGSNQKIKGFSLDGQKRKVVGGIFAQNAKTNVFDDLNIQNFRSGAIFLGEGNLDSEIKNCYIKNNSLADAKTGDAGNVMFQFGKNLSIHDNYIEEQGAMSPNLGGACIKRAQCCGWDYENSHYHDGLKIFNNTIIAPEVGGWDNGKAPAMAIEICGGLLKNVEIYNNYINNCVSLVGNFSGATSGSACHVHHNYFKMGKDRYAYAIEANVPGLEIDHNIFDGGINPISQWDDRRTDATFYGHIIHHNVWYDQNAEIFGNKDLPLLHYNKAPIGGKGFQFFNNTLIDVNGVSKIFGINQFTKVTIQNNLFLSIKGVRGDIFGSPYTGTVSNNGFFNITPKGTETVISDPQLKLEGSTPFFELKDASPAINAGIAIAGITDNVIDGNPDLGAFEYGVPAWKAGIVITDSNAPSAPVGLSADPKSTYIILSWQASVDENFIKEYEIYRDGIIVGTTSNQAYKVSGLKPTTEYSFYIKGKDIAGNVSENSNTTSFKTLVADIEKPSAPQNLSASNVTYKGLVLTWNQATDNEEIKGYKIYKGGILFKSTTNTDTLIALTGLTASTAYSFSVKAIDLTGNISDFSPSYEVTTAELPDPYVTARGESAGTGEVATNLSDGNKNTKWLFNSRIAWVQYSFKEAHVWNTYKIVSGNDDATRDFKTWTLKGSNDGMAWDSLDTKTNQNWSARNQSKTFTFLNANPYKLYKLNITANNGNIELIQASEITFSFNPSADIETISTPNLVHIYPNPSNGIVIVEFADTKNSTLTITDISGKELYRKAGVQSGQKVDLSAHKGLILVNVEIQGKKVTQRIIIK